MVLSFASSEGLSFTSSGTSSAGQLETGSGPRALGRHACWWRALFAAGVVLGETGQNVSLPIFADFIGGSGGSPYFVVWFASLCFVILFGGLMLLQICAGGIKVRKDALVTAKAQIGPAQIGLCDALNGMMVVFASPSARTPPFLQALLGNLIIPMTIVIRMGLLNKRPSPQQFVSAALVLCGIFLSLLPTILGWGQSTGTAVASVFWPCWFMAGFIPAAFMNVVQERVLHQEHRRANMICFVFWLNFLQFVFVSSLFWLVIIPGYGMSSNLQQWNQHMRRGFECFFFGGDCGSGGFSSGLAFVLLYMASYVASGLLLRHTEGATWQAVVTALVGPLSTSWWSVFQPRPHFHWGPSWSIDMTFAVCGLLTMMPGIFLYHLNGKQAKVAGSDEDIGADTRRQTFESKNPLVASLLVEGHHRLPLPS